MEAKIINNRDGTFSVEVRKTTLTLDGLKSLGEMIANAPNRFTEMDLAREYVNVIEFFLYQPLQEAR